MKAVIWLLILNTFCLSIANNVYPPEITKSLLFKHFFPQPHNGPSKSEQLAHSTNTKQFVPNPLIPVVIIPSLIGNKIEAKLSNDVPDHWFCWKNSDWFLIWIEDYDFVLPYAADCFYHNMKLQYNTTSNMYEQIPGVEVRFPGYGSTDGVEYVDTFGKFPIWHNIITNLTQYGYKKGVSIRAATYDWRVGPTNYGDQYAKLKALIEDTYTINGDQPVAAVSLSMGSPYFTLFLNEFVNQEWKDKYIHSFTSLSGVFGGSSATLPFLALEVDGNMGEINAKSLADMARTFGSLPWLLPYKEVWGDKVFVSTPTFNYTASDFVKLLNDANHPIIAQSLEAMEKYRTLKAPGVAMNCVYGYNISTAATIQLPQGFNNNSNYIGFEEDGDQTVLTPALRRCEDWASQQSQPLKSFPLVNMAHGDGVTDKRAVNIFLTSLGLPPIK